jgi:hypothetical protein
MTTSFHQRAGEMLGAALSYAADGLPVFPVKRESKEPHIKGGEPRSRPDRGMVAQIPRRHDRHADRRRQRPMGR